MEEEGVRTCQNGLTTGVDKSTQDAITVLFFPKDPSDQSTNVINCKKDRCPHTNELNPTEEDHRYIYDFSCHFWSKKSGFQGQKQWPPKFHTTCRTPGPLPPHLGLSPKFYHFLLLPLSWI